MKVIQLSNAEFLPHVTGLVAEGHDVSIRAKGQSMRPFIESERDIAVLSKEEAFEVGDVVLAEIDPGHYVLHRIDKIEDANGKVVKGKTKDADAKVTLRGDGNVPNPVNGGVEHCELRDIHALCSQVVRKGKTWDLRTSRFWKVYSWTWPRLLPARRYLLALYKLLWLRQLPYRWQRK